MDSALQNCLETLPPPDLREVATKRILKMRSFFSKKMVDRVTKAENNRDAWNRELEEAKKELRKTIPQHIKSLSNDLANQTVSTFIVFPIQLFLALNYVLDVCKDPNEPREWIICLASIFSLIGLAFSIYLGESCNTTMRVLEKAL